MLRVGLFGGTFNPIHLGHLHVAEEARVRLGLDRIVFIPNQVAPHRPDLSEIAPSRDRYVMTCLAVNAHPLFEASSVELDRPEVSYTYDTLTALRREHPDQQFTFLAGSDSLLRSKWHRLDDVLGLLDAFLVVSRPGFSRTDLETHLATLDLSHRDRVSWLEIPGTEISATDIRDRIQRGQAWRYLVPEPVYEYIQKRRLYATPPGGPGSAAWRENRGRRGGSGCKEGVHRGAERSWKLREHRRGAPDDADGPPAHPNGSAGGPSKVSAAECHGWWRIQGGA